MNLIQLIFAVFMHSCLALATVQNYLYISRADLSQNLALIKRQDIRGLQIIYNWKLLEKSKGEYDFSSIEQDLAFLSGLRKGLFVQLQDRFFSPGARNLPSYLLEDPRYKGGLAPQVDDANEIVGWVAKQWVPAVRRRYQRLLFALARKFDGRIVGINLPETAIDLSKDEHGFDCKEYFSSVLENIMFARGAFKKSHVVQYANFWPCSQKDSCRYMEQLFAFARKNGIGLGGPDVVPDQEAHMRSVYRVFNRYKGRLSLVAMAIQEPTLEYINPKTNAPFTNYEFAAFAKNYLGANIIFWCVASMDRARQSQGQFIK